MVSLEEVINKFESGVVGGAGRIYGVGAQDTKLFSTLYMPQLFIDENWLEARDELNFDADYNLSGMRLFRKYRKLDEENVIDMSVYVKPLLKRWELTKLIHDPRYIYEHNKDKITKVNDNLYTLDLDYDLGSALPAVKMRINFVLEFEQLESLKISSVDAEGKETPRSQVAFNYLHPWQKADTSTAEALDETEEAKVDGSFTFGDDVSNAWME